MEAQAQFQQRLKAIEQLTKEIESTADPSLRASVQELVCLVMDLHGAGLERMLEVIRAPGDGGEVLIHKLGRDELVASLLVLYGLHPLSLEARVMQALDKAGSKLRSHQGEVELLGIEDGVVRLRLQANGHSCGSTGAALKEIVEDAVYQAAPDIRALVIEGADEKESKEGFVPLEMLRAAPPLPPALAFAGDEKGGL